ncbi:hypothetical protein P1P75_02875 [Streptomyces sp. ID05-39B]|uniref:hypothetical protein n=2 Tax=Streptomyces TaxID=1883 RepID=UPI0029A704DD|nr:hypothetical protein [Streptomyces sp. ID05-39B]MDX3525405.1 hypothetical protein [Streptomyces sp. ID05-39B]
MIFKRKREASSLTAPESESAMFDHVGGLRPEEAARWVTLVEESRPILAKDGMEAVQTFLAERGVGIIPAIAITRALLGMAETPLRVAIDIVATSTARQ